MIPSVTCSDNNRLFCFATASTGARLQNVPVTALVRHSELEVTIFIIVFTHVN